jgi:hypothetical protein
VEGKKLKLSVKQKNGLLYLTQATGIVFVFSFLTAYFGGRLLGGLSSTETLNNNPDFVFLQSLIGILFLALVMVTLIFTFFLKHED